MTSKTMSLRQIFNEFDADNSGHVSTSELGRVMTLLKLDSSPSAVKKLMKEADPSGDGQISFKEFEAVLKRQMAKGGGELASVLEAGGAAGWFGGLLGGLFGGGGGGTEERGGASSKSGAPTPAKPAPRTATRGAQVSPHASSAPRSAARGQAPATRGAPDSVRTLTTTGEDFSPTHRMWATQAEIQVANRESAHDVKQLASAGKARKDALHASFLAAQQQKVEDARKQEARKRQQQELLRYEKRYAGWEMKVKQQQMQQEENMKRERYAASANKRATSAKKRRARAQLVAQEEAAEQRTNTLLASKQEREQRKEQAKATKRAEEERARQYTAQVRHETRKEVREEGQVLFQARRDAIAAEEKAKQEADVISIEETRQLYQQRKLELKSKVESLHEAARQARKKIDIQRKQDAAQVRSLLDAERTRQLREREAAMAAKREMRDELYAWKKEGIIVV